MAAYPLITFHYEVDWGGASSAFSEVSGLNLQTQVLEYRYGISPQYTMQKMPGMQTWGSINLKRGIFRDNNEFYEWWNTVSLTTIERRDITISLLDENHEPTMVWKVREAWPSKIEGPNLQGDQSGVAIESLEIQHEGITMEMRSST